MAEKIPVNKVYTPPGGPPQGAAPSKEIYAAMGEEKIFKMCEDFYEEVGASAIDYMFPKELKEASQKSAAFFVGLLGGPPLYHQRYGNPQLRARHLPFPIDEQARQTWMSCFKHVLRNAEEKYAFPPEHLPGFIQFLERFSGWMVNKE